MTAYANNINAYEITIPITVTVTMDEMDGDGDSSAEIAADILAQQIRDYFGDADIQWGDITFIDITPSDEGKAA